MLAHPGDRRLGSLWMLVAGLLFAGMGVFVKLGTAHFSSAEMVFYRSLFGVLAVLAVVRVRGLSARTPHWRLHVWRSLAGFGGMMLLFHVIGILPLATATTLNYTSPLFMVLLSTLVLRHRPRPALVVATLSFGSYAAVMVTECAKVLFVKKPSEFPQTTVADASRTVPIKPTSDGIWRRTVTDRCSKADKVPTLFHDIVPLAFVLGAGDADTKESNGSKLMVTWLLPLLAGVKLSRSMA